MQALARRHGLQLRIRTLRVPQHIRRRRCRRLADVFEFPESTRREVGGAPPDATTRRVCRDGTATGWTPGREDIPGRRREEAAGIACWATGDSGLNPKNKGPRERSEATKGHIPIP